MIGFDRAHLSTFGLFLHLLLQARKYSTEHNHWPKRIAQICTMRLWSSSAGRCIELWTVCSRLLIVSNENKPISAAGADFHLRIEHAVVTTRNHHLAHITLSSGGVCNGRGFYECEIALFVNVWDFATTNPLTKFTKRWKHKHTIWMRFIASDGS